MILYTLVPVLSPGIRGFLIPNRDRIFTFVIEVLDDALLFPLRVLRHIDFPLLSNKVNEKPLMCRCHLPGQANVTVCFPVPLLDRGFHR